MDITEDETLGSRRPLNIGPAETPLGALSRDQLRRVTELAIPAFEYRRVSELLHALRVWGTAARFSGAPPYPVPNGVATLSSEQMLRILLDGAEYAKEFQGSEPYLFRTRYGVAARVGTGHTRTPHQDDLLALLAELGLPLGSIIHVGPADHTVSDLLAESLNRFVIEQELEFTAVAYARYLSPRRSWRNRFGEEYSFDDIAQALIARPQKDGSCAGTHVPFALVNLLRADSATAILQAGTRKQVRNYLRNLSRELELTQEADGSWSVRYRAASSAQSFLGAADERITVTGHHLEWIALAPADVRPSHSAVGRAALWLFAALSRERTLSPIFLAEYTSKSHAVNALLQLEHVAACDLLTSSGGGP